MAFGTDKKSGDFGGYDSMDSTPGSFFGKTMSVEGEITSDEDLTIEGKVDGQLEISKTLTIGKDGYVKGDISAAVVRISGEAEGHLKASQKLEIHSHGKFSGDIKSDVIVVAEGAKLKGTINREDEKKAASPPKPVPGKAKPAPQPETVKIEDTKKKTGKEPEDTGPAIEIK
jgi:cytoskeletal protein CcmA (bactofilin family)